MKAALDLLPRPEYPRPEFFRKASWINLNGEWSFAFDDKNIGTKEKWFEEESGKIFDKKIIVPFAYQFEASGINDKSIHEVVWYSRKFTIPETQAWNNKDILLHFGAVDYKTTVWINGQEVGHNHGGHVPFSFNIYPYVKRGEHEENTIVLRVVDLQDARQPRGKQASSGISKSVDYYCTTGIWQTAWLEPAPKMRIDSVKIKPLVDEGGFELVVYLHAPSIGWKIEASISNHEDTENVITKTDRVAHNAVAKFMIKIPEPKLWTPDSPNLYDIHIKLIGSDPNNDRDGDICDEVRVYTGLRSVGLKNGKVVLNNDEIYLKMILDQGYWPKSGMTACTAEELRRDVEIAIEMGFNGARKHQKIEDPIWLYWCDKLGLMVWSEMPNAREWSSRTEELFLMEWERMLQRDYNHPCIITWVPNNESWGYPGIREWHYGQYAFVERIVTQTRKLDITRPVVDNDGWEHTDIVDICAIHDYAKTGEELKNNYIEMIEKNTLPEYVGVMVKPLYIRGSRFRGQPIILTECGGFLNKISGKNDDDHDELYHSYGSIESNDKLLENYEDLIKGISELSFISGFCYTQLTDIEQERNGLLTYDRQPKIQLDRINEINRKYFK
jgi:beta-galactosidase/beta-glucuronidase